MSSQKQSKTGGASADDGSSSSDVAKSKRISSLRHGATRASGSRTQPASVITTTSNQTANITGSTTLPSLQQTNQQQPVQYIVVNSTAARPSTAGPSLSGTMPQQQFTHLTPQTQSTSFNTFMPRAPAGAPTFPFTQAPTSSGTPVIYDTQRLGVASGFQNQSQQQQWGPMQLFPVHFVPVSTADGAALLATSDDNGTQFRPLNNFRHANIVPETKPFGQTATGQRFAPLDNATYSLSVASTTHAPSTSGQRMLPVHGTSQPFTAAFLPNSQFATSSVAQQQNQNSASPLSLSPAINVTPAMGDHQQTSPSTASGLRSRNPSSLAAQRAASSNANSSGSNPNLSPQHSIATPNNGSTPAVSPLPPRSNQPQRQQQQQQFPRRSNTHSAAISQNATASAANADDMDEDDGDNDDTGCSFAENSKNNATLSAFLLDADDTDETFLDDDFDAASSSCNFTDSPTANAAGRSAALQQFRERRRAAHLQAEKKRRNSIQHGFQELKELLPPLPSDQGGGAGLLRATKAVVLQRAVSYCEMLRKTNTQSNDKLAKLRQEAEGLEIMRDQLQQFVAQAAAAPQQSNDHSHFPSKTNDAAAQLQAASGVARPSSSADDAEMYFDVFRGFADALFSSYNRAVSTQDFKSISGTSIQWLEQYCAPQSTQRHVQQAANHVFGGAGGRGAVDVQGMQ